MNTAYQIEEGYTRDNGTIDVFVETNDNLDLGYPNEFASWKFTCKNKEAFDKRCGKSHYGCSGIKVTVKLDGKEIK